MTYTNGVMTAVSQPTGDHTEGNGVTGTFSYDPTGAESGVAWSFPNGQSTVSDAVTRSQSGKILTDTLADGSTTYGSSYTYDAADRLTKAVVPWNTLTYGFASSGGCGANAASGADGNRTSFQDVPSSGSTFTMNTCYDNADRLTSDSVGFSGTTPTGADTLESTALSTSGTSPNLAYDSHGNTTKLADQTLSYDGADRLTSISSTGGANPSNAANITYERDATGRPVSETTTTSDGTSKTKDFVYTDGSDSAAYITDSSGNLTDRFLNLSGGVTGDSHGWTSGVWSYSDVHGDVTVTADGSGNRTGNIALYDPFGDPIDLVTHSIGTFAADGDQPSNLTGTTSSLGWEGSHEKISDHAGDISSIEMSARQYVAVLGRFLQVDPQFGGNSNAYNYPNDPTDGQDLSGQTYGPEEFDEGLTLQELQAETEAAEMVMPRATSGETSATKMGRVIHAIYSKKNIYKVAYGEGFLPEQRVPNSRMRADAVDYENRTILELKPNNARAIARGYRQGARYAKHFAHEFGGKWTVVVITYGSAK